MTTTDNPNSASAADLLQSWIRRELLVNTHMLSVGDKIEQVAAGMLDLASLDCNSGRRGARELVYVVPDLTNAPLAKSFRPGPDMHMLVLMMKWLPSVPHEVFGYHGSLGLKSISLVVDPHDPTNTVLSLGVPDRSEGATRDSFAVFEFPLTRAISVKRCNPSFAEDGPLEASLGLTTPDTAWMQDVRSFAGNNDRVLGPGCTALLRGSLSDLGLYLKTVASQLRSQA